MEMVLFVLSWVSIIAGGVFCIIGAFGMLKMPDVFTRLHAASLIDTLGIGLIFLGLAFQAGFTLVLAKLAMVLVFVFFTSPTGTHALCRAILSDGMQPETIDGSRAVLVDEPETSPDEADEAEEV